jgi:serine/threonine protein kinase
MLQKDPLIGLQVSNFRIVKQIGSGGMARVYYGVDMTLQRPVAIKIIDTKYRKEKQYAERFLSEARVVASWRHKNICQIYFADNQDGLLYYVMEYIDGLDLKEMMSNYHTRGELIPHDDVIRITRGIASALDYAHKSEVIHRDVKPANVIIDAEGQVFLADFGLAKTAAITRESLGDVFGTAHYISPEQARSSSNVVPQSDIYSLAVVVYEMLTGVVPFDDPSPVSVAMSHVNSSPPPPRSVNPNLPPAAESVLLKALAKVPAERFQSATKFIDHLERSLAPSLDANKNLMPLPPLPAGARSKGAKPVSNKSMLEVIAERPTRSLRQKTVPLARSLTPAPAPGKGDQEGMAAHEPSPEIKKRGYSGWWIVGILLVIGLILVTGLLASQTGRFGNFPIVTPTSTILASPTAAPTEIPATATQVPATATNAPTATKAPATAQPTATEVVAGGTVADATDTPVGLHIILFYDETGLYLKNDSRVRLNNQPFAFRAYDSDGELLAEFLGELWARFNDSVREEWCNRIEIRGFSEITDYPNCVFIEAVRTIIDNRELDFWTADIGAVEFVVYWNDEEVGRCPVGENTCDIYLPLP